MGELVVFVMIFVVVFAFLWWFFHWRDKRRRRQVTKEIDAVVMAANIANETGEIQKVYISGFGTISVYPMKVPQRLFDVYEDEHPDHLHASHKVRFSNGGSTYDYICERCGNTDLVPGGWGKLAAPCPIPLEEQ